MDWQRKPVEEVCNTIVDCINNTAPTVDEDTPYKMIRTPNVRDGYVRLDDVKNVDKETYEEWTRRVTPRSGDIILTREAPLGAVGMLRTNESTFLGQRLVLYRPNTERLDNHFLLYALMSHEVQGQIQGFGSGATVPHMRVPDCGRIEIPVPPIQTQKKIGSALAKYDELIEKNRERISVIEEMVMLLYREWFVHYRFPGSQEIEMVDSKIGEIPKGWDVRKFTDIAEVLTGGTPSTKNEGYWDGEFPFFTPMDAHGGYFVHETKKHTTKVGIEDSTTELYPPRTIFITARGTVGNLALPAVPMAMNQSCYGLQGDEGFSQEFLFLLVQERIDYLQKNTGGATFDTIIIDTFRKMDVLVPPQNLVSKFTEIVKPFFDLLPVLGEKNQNLKQTRDLLLPRLVSGELDLSELDINIDNDT